MTEEQYKNIWVRENVRRELKKIAANDEMSMRELASIILETWIEERATRYSNDTTKKHAEVLPKKKPDA